MTIYDKFMWWSIQNRLNFEDVLIWYLTKRVKGIPKSCKGHLEYERSNRRIKKWLCVRIIEESFAI